MACIIALDRVDGYGLQHGSQPGGPREQT
jgi:hypothetical protein